MLKNTTKVWLIIFLFSVVFMFSHYLYWGRLGLFLGLIFAIVINIFIFLNGDGDITSRLDVKTFSGNDPWGANKLLKTLSHKLDIEQPTFNLIHSSNHNAFCGWQIFQGSFICITDAALETFSKTEIEALLAQQICFLKVTDTLRHRLATVITNTILGLGYFIDGFLPINFLPKTNKHIFLKPFSWLGYLVLKLAYRPSDYLLADNISTDLIKSRGPLSQVIWKMENSSFFHTPSLPPCTSYMFATYPFGQYKDKKFLMYHPPIDLRLEKLLGYFPL